jgi:hypothetical protein
MAGSQTAQYCSQQIAAPEFDLGRLRHANELKLKLEIRSIAPYRGEQLFLAFRYVAPSIPRFVSLEVRTVDTLGWFSFLTAFGRWALISMLWMETVIHVALEITRAVKPGASADEAVPVKPFWTIVASGSTAVRSNVVVTIGAVRGHADFDVDLSLGLGSDSGEADSSNSS